MIKKKNTDLQYSITWKAWGKQGLYFTFRSPVCSLLDNLTTQLPNEASETLLQQLRSFLVVPIGRWIPNTPTTANLIWLWHSLNSPMAKEPLVNLQRVPNTRPHPQLQTDLMPAEHGVWHFGRPTPSTFLGSYGYCHPLQKETPNCEAI